MRVVLVLKVMEFPPEDYRIFLHFEESLHPRHRFQGDHDPLGDTRPSTSWLPGEIVADTTWVRVPSRTPPGRYRVWAGLFVPLGCKPRLGGDDRGRVSVGWLNVIG